MAAPMIEKRKLGSQGLVVPALGLGTMGMTAFYGNFNRKEAEAGNLATIAKALELGMNFFDTAWIYQSFGQDGQPNETNEELLGKAIAKHGRDKFIIATKFGVGFNDKGERIVSGKPDFIRTQLSQSLQRLGTDHVDLYYQHRIDPSTPIEETVRCLAELVKEGKIKYIGLSECTPDELRKAHAIHPISAIQMEWSLTTRDIEKTVVPVARELGVGIVPYSPLGRGLLTGTISKVENLDENDWRRKNPRFQADTIGKNTPIQFFAIAERKKCTPAQLALAWVLSRGHDVVPIPGTKSVERLEENFGALRVSLTPEEITEVEASIPEIQGDRYDEEAMKASYANRL